MEKEICPSCGSQANFVILKGERGLGVAQLYMCSECEDKITRCTICGKPIKWGLQCVGCLGNTTEKIFSPIEKILSTIVKNYKKQSL